jgi:hypothetical protein
MPKDLVLALLFGVCAAFALVTLSVVAVQRRADDRLCRHTIQRHFNAEREAAQRMIEETRLWESQ